MLTTNHLLRLPNADFFRHKGHLLSFFSPLIFTLLLTGCDARPAASPAPRQVKVWTVPAAQRPAQMTWSGTLEPAQQLSLHFRLDGELATRPVEVGSRVKKGQVLATLKGVQSEEETAATLAEYQDALAEVSKGMLALDRVKKLYQVGTASRAQLDEATANMAALNARKSRALAQRAMALNTSGFNAITSPVDGVVTRVVPSPGQSLTAGQEVVTIASGPTEVQFFIPATHVPSLSAGDNVSVMLEGKPVPARIRYISPQLDDVTRTRQVRATLATAPNVPLFGEAVAVALDASTAPGLRLPASALIRSGNQPAVYVVNPQTSKLEVRAVSLQRFSADGVWISQGVKPGEHVVSAGVTTLVNDEKVRIFQGGAQ